MREIIELNGEWELHPVSEFSNLWISGEAPAEGWLTQEIPAHWQEHRPWLLADLVLPG